MSVTHPADSGGGINNIALHKEMQASNNIFEEMAEQMQNMGGWAEIMEQEYDPDSNLNSEPTTVDNRGTPRRKIPDEPPFKAQVANVDFACLEELLHYFGGEDVVKNIEEERKRGSVTIEFYTKEGLMSAREKHESTLGDRVLSVFILRPAERREDRPGQIRDRTSYNSHNSHDGRRSNEYSSVPYSGGRQGSQYNSQSSVFSNDARSSGGYRRGSHTEPNRRYDTLPARGSRGNYQDRYSQGGGHRGDYGGYGSRGAYRGNRGGGYGQYDYQRSGSYNQDREYPAPINRSRTDSMASEQAIRNDLHSRTSSRLSVENDEGSTKKVSIFGDAKPVDTQARLREIEERKERERLERIEKERLEQKEKDDLAAAQTAAARDHHSHSHQRQHHNPHRQHAPSPHYNHGGYIHPASMHPYQGAEQYIGEPRFAMPYVPESSGYTCPPPAFVPRGNVKILQRESSSPVIEQADQLPPVDPHHTPLNVVEPNEEKVAMAVSTSFDSIEQKTSHTMDGKNVEDVIENSKRLNTSQSSYVSHNDGSQFKKPTQYRTFTNTNQLQKSATSGQIYDQAKPRGGFASRGRGRGRPYGADRTGSYSSSDVKVTDGERTTNAEQTGKPLSTSGSVFARSPRVSTNEESSQHENPRHSQQFRSQQKSSHQSNTLPRSDRKDHHSSQTSLRDKGFSGRGNRGGDRAGYKGSGVNDRPPRDHMKDEKSGNSAGSGKPHHQRGNYPSRGGHHNRRTSIKSSTDDVSKSAAGAEELSQKKKINKEDFIAPVAAKTSDVIAPSNAPEPTKPAAEPITATDVNNAPKDKKKEKKKAKKETSKAATALCGNKFAALLEADD